MRHSRRPLALAPAHCSPTQIFSQSQVTAGRGQQEFQGPTSPQYRRASQKQTSCPLLDLIVPAARAGMPCASACTAQCRPSLTRAANRYVHCFPHTMSLSPIAATSARCCRPVCRLFRCCVGILLCLELQCCLLHGMQSGDGRLGRQVCHRQPQ